MSLFASLEQQVDASGESALSIQQLMAEIVATLAQVSLYIQHADSSLHKSHSVDLSDPSEVLAHIDSLLIAVTHHTFDEADLAALNHINKDYESSVSAIVDALDNFDFDIAHDALTNLRLAISSNKE